MIHTAIDVIAAEQKEDEKKEATCAAEQSANNDNKADAESEMRSLDSKIDGLNVDISDTTDDLEQAKRDLADNREAQATATDQRSKEKAQFEKEDKNANDTQALLTKALE